MRITNLHHSGFTVELEQTVLIFDCYQDPAQMLPTILQKGKQVIYFVSHWHPDHYSPLILENADKPSFYYVIDRQTVERHHLDKRIDASRLLIANEGDRYWRGTNELIRLPDIESVAVFGSTDEGVSYLLRTQSNSEKAADQQTRMIYHAGDLNDWDWQDDPSPNPAMRRAYREQLLKIKEYLDASKSVECVSGDQPTKDALSRPDNLPTIDLAFVPVDQRLGEMAFNGVEILLEYFRPKLIVPMHLNGGTDLPKKLASRLNKRADHGQTRVVQLIESGSVFETGQCGYKVSRKTKGK